MKDRLVFLATFICLSSASGAEVDNVFKHRTYTCQVNAGQYWPGDRKQAKALEESDRLYIRTEKFDFRYAGSSTSRAIVLTDFIIRWSSEKQGPFKTEMAQGYDLANLNTVSLEMQNSLVLNAAVAWTLPGYGEAPLILSAKGVAEKGKIRLSFNFSLPHAKSTKDSRYSNVNVLIDCQEKEAVNEPGQ